VNLLTFTRRHALCRAAQGAGIPVVTETWLSDASAAFEAGKRAPSPDSRALYEPPAEEGGVPAMRSLVVCVTGYTGELRDDLKEMVRQLGATYGGNLCRTDRVDKESGNLLTPRTTHLVAHSFEGAKYDRAVEWGIAVVNHGWLEECMRRWECLPVQDFTSESGGDLIARKEREAEEAQGQMCGPAEAAEAIREGAPAEEAEMANERAPAAFAPVGDADAIGAAKKTPKRPAPPPLPAAEDALHGKADEPSSGKRQRTAPRVQEGAHKGKAEGVSSGPAKAGALVGGVSEEGLAPASAVDFEGDATAAEQGAKAGVRKRKLYTAKASVEVQKTTGLTPGAGLKRAAARTAGEAARDLASSALQNLGQAAGRAGGRGAAVKPARTSPRKKTLGGSGHHCFTLGGLSDAHRSRYSAIVRSLGGTVLSVATGQEYSPQTTHVVQGDLKRTEKFVCAAASGKWVLKPSYLDACEQAGEFVDEEAHEWYSPGRGVNDEKTVWVGCVRRWRLHIAGDPMARGAFAGLRVAIHPDVARPPPASLKRIIQCGGGQVMNVNAASPARSGIGSVEYAAVSANTPASDSRVRAWMDAGIPLVRDEYFADFVSKYNVDLNDYLYVPPMIGEKGGRTPKSATRGRRSSAAHMR